MGFIPVFRMIVTSDIHTNMNEDKQIERFVKGMKFAYNYAASSKYDRIDAFFAVGDFANSGTEEEMLKFRSSLNESIASDTDKTLMLASHEFKSNGQKKAENLLKKLFAQQPDVHKVYNGYHCICLSTEDGCRIKDEKKAWLREQLRQASLDDPKKPIFCFQHPHLTDTVYGSIAWGDDDIISILMDYPQVVDFSGHSHAPVNDPRSVHQKYFSSFGTGSFNYFELDEFDKIYGTVPPDAGECGQYLIVEADVLNRVRVYPVDAITGNFFPYEWKIDTPSEPDTFIYTDTRYSTDIKPYFEDNSALNVSVDGNAVNITFDQAKIDEDYVDSYILRIRNSLGGNIIRQINVSSSYYLYNMPEKISVEVNNIPDGDYSVSITACGFWNNYSDQISVDFTVGA